jgi:hypothetical protein
LRNIGGRIAYIQSINVYPLSYTCFGAGGGSALAAVTEKPIPISVNMSHNTSTPISLIVDGNSALRVALTFDIADLPGCGDGGGGALFLIDMMYNGEKRALLGWFTIAIYS